MKKVRLLIAFALLVLALPMAAQESVTVWYVKHGGAGNGSSWFDAFGDVQKAITVAQPGDQIWVAKGIYMPTSNRNRSASFVIKSGVELYGGFSGTESYLSERDWESNPTVLSGNIGDASSPLDNSFNVVKFYNASEATILDGFVIGDGEATKTTSLGDPNACGAGIYNVADGQKSNPVISNCRFVNNYAYYGGAIFNYAKNGGICKPVIEASEFERNVASLDGGAIYNYGKQGRAVPHIRESLFKKNGANYGAVVFTKYPTSCDQVPLFTHCQFIENAAYTRGKVNYDAVGTDFCSPRFSGCIYDNNYAGIGKQPDQITEEREQIAPYRRRR